MCAINAGNTWRPCDRVLCCAGHCTCEWAGRPVQGSSAPGPSPDPFPRLFGRGNFPGTIKPSRSGVEPSHDFTGVHRPQAPPKLLHPGEQPGRGVGAAASAAQTSPAGAGSVAATLDRDRQGECGTSGKGEPAAEGLAVPSRSMSSSRLCKFDRLLAENVVRLGRATLPFPALKNEDGEVLTIMLRGCSRLGGGAIARVAVEGLGPGTGPLPRRARPPPPTTPLGGCAGGHRCAAGAVLERHPAQTPARLLALAAGVRPAQRRASGGHPEPQTPRVQVRR